MVLIADEENIQEYDRLVAEGGHTEEELNRFFVKCWGKLQFIYHTRT